LAQRSAHGHNGVAEALVVEAVSVSALQIGTFIASLAIAFLACPRPRIRYPAAIIVYPFLHWVAAYRALHQLITAPFLWAKTIHHGHTAGWASATCLLGIQLIEQALHRGAHLGEGLPADGGRPLLFDGGHTVAGVGHHRTSPIGQADEFGAPVAGVGLSL
jgi:hypothetical protein